MAQRSRKSLAAWLTSSTTPIFVIDHRQVVLVFNRGCEELTGWSASDLIGATCQRYTEGNPEKVESLTGMLAPPERVLRGEPAVVPAIIPGSESAGTVEIHFFPLPSSADDTDFRILGLIAPLTGSGIEVVPPSEWRRFELAQIFDRIYREFDITGLVADSLTMQRVARQLDIGRKHQQTIHFHGERGTGKEYLARLIHYGSTMREKRFFPLNCKSSTHFEIARTLRRLFAESPTETVIGSVHLKEVDCLPRDLQVELQQHLDSGTQFRWTSSSQKPLEQNDRESISPALASSLTTIEVAVPPLRERQADILALATHFLEVSNRQHGEHVESLAPDVEQEILKYQWPGNVTELANVITRSQKNCARQGQQTVLLEHLGWDFQAGRDAQRTRPVKPGQSLQDYLSSMERKYLEEVLQSTAGNKSQAAEILGVPRAKLYRRLAALGIQAEDDQAEATN